MMTRRVPLVDSQSVVARPQCVATACRDGYCTSGRLPNRRWPCHCDVAIMHRIFAQASSLLDRMAHVKQTAPGTVFSRA